jgi:hypothetical protein
LVHEHLFQADVAQGSYYAIFDGHAGKFHTCFRWTTILIENTGDRAARYAAEQLHVRLCRRLKPDMDGKMLKRTVTDVYQQIDKEVDCFLHLLVSVNVF